MTMLRKIKEVTTDVAVVGSREVIDAANGFIAVVMSKRYVQTMNTANLQTRGDTPRHHDKLTGSSRRKVLEAMRRDLFPWWHFSSRNLPDKPHLLGRPLPPALLPLAPVGCRTNQDEPVNCPPL
jgi:hypothetical protein